MLKYNLLNVIILFTISILITSCGSKNISVSNNNYIKPSYETKDTNNKIQNSSDEKKQNIITEDPEEPQRYKNTFFSFFTNDNAYINNNRDYPPDVLSVKDGLNILVLKVKERSPKNSNLNNLTNSNIYNNYMNSLKNEGLLRNNQEAHPNQSLSNLHKTLIANLLLKKGKDPEILYIFYKRLNKSSNLSTKKELALIRYLSYIRAYIYSKKVPLLYIQEVEIDSLPIDEILFVLKPITMNQYNTLPKQINIYNANKVDTKTPLTNTKDANKAKNIKK